METFVNHILQWVNLHPHLSGFMVGFIACAEALAFVGMLVPGAVLMLAAGALVGVGALDFWSILAWSVAGAIVGDGVSYWLGHHYRDQLKNIAFLRRHPHWLMRGTEFFHRHGGKSILLARFVGPVRPVIPVVAGMLGMSPYRFYANNIISALIWAPAHLLAGMLVGASLVIAGQVATRLAIILVLLLLLAWLVLWLVHLIYRVLQPRISQWAAQVMRWSASHPNIGWLFADIYDPQRPPAPAIVIWLGLLIAAAWVFFGVLEDVLRQDPLVDAGKALFHFLQQLRTPLGDSIMVIVTELGDAAVTLPVSIAVIIWLLTRRAWRDSLYFLAAIAFGEVIVTMIKFLLKLPRPVPLFSGAEAFSFPSNHAAMSTVIYGLLAVFLAHSIHRRWRWLIYAILTLLVVTISFSRLYLGAHWLADVMAGFALGTVGVAVIAIACERREPSSPSGYGLLVITCCVFIAAAVWHGYRHYDSDLQRYAVRHPIEYIGASRHWDSECELLPTWRIDLKGERGQPLNVRWAGDLSLIRQQLLSHGWQVPLSFNSRTALAWLLPKPSLNQLPILPRLHDGQYESLLLIHPQSGKQDGSEQFILRLWPTTLRLQGDNQTLWVGTVASQQLRQLPLISYPRLSPNFDLAVDFMLSNLDSVKPTVLPCDHPIQSKKTRWDGKIVVLSQPIP